MIANYSIGSMGRLLSAPILLAGCSPPNQEFIPDDDKAAADNTIVLSCDGNRSVGTKSELTAYVIKIHPGNEFQRSLHFYSDNEKRFMSPCEESGYDCGLKIGKDLITEVGDQVVNGQVAQQNTQINRNTGVMRVQAISATGLPTLTLFEGVCRKGEMPAAEEKKF